MSQNQVKVLSSPGRRALPVMLPQNMTCWFDRQGMSNRMSEPKKTIPDLVSFEGIPSFIPQPWIIPAENRQDEGRLWPTLAGDCLVVRSGLWSSKT